VSSQDVTGSAAEPGLSDPPDTLRARPADLSALFGTRLIPSEEVLRRDR
jgi:hypothetical protein